MQGLIKLIVEVQTVFKARVCLRNCIGFIIWELILAVLCIKFYIGLLEGETFDYFFYIYYEIHLVLLYHFAKYALGLLF